MKKTSKQLLLLTLVLGAAALGLAACGQRVIPQPPEGKIVPSNQY